MPQRTRTRGPDLDLGRESAHSGHLDSLSVSELDTFLFEEEVEKPPSTANIATVSGLALLGLAAAQLVTSVLEIDFLPMAGLNAVAIGGGLLAFIIGLAKKKRKKGRKSRLGGNEMASMKGAGAGAKGYLDTLDSHRSGRRGPYKSLEKKFAFGVCGGLSEWLNIPVSIVRIAFVLGTLFAQGSGVVVYLVLAIALRNRY